MQVTFTLRGLWHYSEGIVRREPKEISHGIARKLISEQVRARLYM